MASEDPELTHPPEGGQAAVPEGSRSYEGDELELFSHATNWKAYWSTLISRYLGRRILDVGAGIGATAEVFRHATCTKWVGLEPDSDLCAQVQRSVLSGKLPGFVEARCGTMRDLDSEERFDTILYIDVLEHIEDDAAELELAARHLAPGGFLVIISPAHNFLYTPFDRAIGHYRRYSRRSLGAIIPSALGVEMLRYLDCAGMLASLGNKLFLKSARPTLAQVRFWDRMLIPVSRALDPLLLGRLGKSLVCVLRTHVLR